MRHKHRRKRKAKRLRDANYLPVHIASSFQQELVTLVDKLPSDIYEGADYLRSEWLSKYLDPTIVTAEQRRQSAILKWMDTERRNAATNIRVLFNEDFGWVDSDTLIEDARSYIRKVLGPIPSGIFTNGYITNGASTRISRSSTSRVEKIGGVAHITPNAVKYWVDFCEGSRLWDLPLQEVPGSVMFTVPKGTEIDRVACKEPEITQFLQRGVGVYIRKRLRRVGIDLLDQTINQNLARIAYDTGLATIDLSSASDSISRSVVMRLLPTDWWVLLDDLRSPTVQIDGETHTMEMFSSMGNGFTFELESLLFWALTRAVSYRSGIKGRISVYGDDIICSNNIAPRLARVFAWFGFRINHSKSNWTGAFRESCGKHFVYGRDISPFYLREKISRKTDIIRVLNQLLVWAAPEGFFVEPMVASFWEKWREVIPQRLWGGLEPESDRSLVTGHAPREVLFQIPKQFNAYGSVDRSFRWINQSDGLNLWLMVKRGGSEPLTVYSGEPGRFTYRPAPVRGLRTVWRADMLSSPSDPAYP